MKNVSKKLCQQFMTTKMHMRCEAMTLVAIGKIILTKEAVR